MSHFRERAHRIRSRCHQMKIDYYHRKYNNDDSPRLISTRDGNTQLLSLRRTIIEDSGDDNLTIEFDAAKASQDATAEVFEQLIYDGAFEDNEYDFYHHSFQDDDLQLLVCDISPPVSAMSNEANTALASKDYIKADNAIISNVKITEANIVDSDMKKVTIVPNIDAALAGVEVLDSNNGFTTNTAKSGNIFNYKYENIRPNAAKSGNVFNFEFENSKSTNSTNSSRFRQIFDFKNGKKHMNADCITSQTVDSLPCDNMADKPVITESKKRSFGRQIWKPHVEPVQSSFTIYGVRPANLNSIPPIPLDKKSVQHPSPPLSQHRNTQFVDCINKYGLNGSRGARKVVENGYSLQTTLLSSGNPTSEAKLINADLTNSQTEKVFIESGHQMSNKVSPAFEVKTSTNGKADGTRLRFFKKLFKRRKVARSKALPPVKGILKKSPSSTATRTLVKRVRINSKTLCIDENGKTEFKPTPTERDYSYPSIEECEANINQIKTFLAASKNPYTKQYQLFTNELARAMVNLEITKTALRTHPTPSPRLKKILNPIRLITPDDPSMESISSDTSENSIDPNLTIYGSNIHSLNGSIASVDSIFNQDSYVDVISNYMSSDTDTADARSTFDDDEEIQPLVELQPKDNNIIAQVTTPDAAVDIARKPSPFTDRELEILNRSELYVKMNDAQKEAYELDQLMGFVSRYQRSLRDQIKLPNISY